MLRFAIAVSRVRNADSASGIVSSAASTIATMSKALKSDPRGLGGGDAGGGDGGSGGGAIGGGAGPFRPQESLPSSPDWVMHLPSM